MNFKVPYFRFISKLTVSINDFPISKNPQTLMALIFFVDNNAKYLGEKFLSKKNLLHRIYNKYLSFRFFINKIIQFLNIFEDIIILLQSI